MKNPQIGIWPKDDDPADIAKEKKIRETRQIDVPELETIKELKAHRRLFRSKIEAIRDKAFEDFMAGNETAMHEIKKIEGKIRLINQTIKQLVGKY